MKSPSCLLLLSLVLAAPASAQEWVSLFNGENLDGWEQHNGTATYRVEDGVVIGKTSAGSPNSFMCTKKHYGDFELTFEVKVDDGLNSGVQIRSHSKAGLQERPRAWPAGRDRVGARRIRLRLLRGHGPRLDHRRPQAPRQVLKNGEWNKYRVVAKGARIQTFINGEGGRGRKRTRQSYKKGFIGLQVHGIKRGTGPFEVRWRNIKIREL